MNWNSIAAQHWTDIRSGCGGISGDGYSKRNIHQTLLLLQKRVQKRCFKNNQPQIAIFWSLGKMWPCPFMTPAVKRQTTQCTFRQVKCPTHPLHYMLPPRTRFPLLRMMTILACYKVRQPPGAVLHSSREPGDLSKWLATWWLHHKLALFRPPVTVVREDL